MNKEELLTLVATVRADLSAIAQETPEGYEAFNALRQRYELATMRLNVAQAQLQAVDIAIAVAALEEPAVV